jgi:hypothetical protein
MEPTISRRGAHAFTVLDLVGVGVGALAALALLAVPLAIAPAFVRVYADLGGALPRLTLLVTSAWFPPSLAALSAGALAGALLVRGRLGLRRGLVAAAVLVPVAGFGVILVGLYLPVFELGRQHQVTARAAATSCTHARDAAHSPQPRRGPARPPAHRAANRCAVQR